MRPTYPADLPAPPSVAPTVRSLLGRTGRSLLAALILLGQAFSAPSAAGDTAVHVGAAVCIACHPDQGAQWRNSDHAKSMQPAVPGKVQGDFDNASFSLAGATTRFFRRGGRYFVHTEGTDGKPRDFPVAYTFGHYPLQQYLIEQPGGRLQALGIAWDARPARMGGQRWFHLYPESPARAGEALHWSGRDQNWNFMCAACHSTNLKRNFDLAGNRFSTTWSDINVACEACHGPGSAHVGWARGRRTAPGKGLATALTGREVAWRFATPESRIASRIGPGEPARAEAEVCFPCHARRQEIGQARPGRAFLDNYLPALLEPTLYHADGQIDGEVFEYGSFTQSRMYRAGVTCGNCHQAHSLKLRAEGNSLCAQCHQPGYYDSREHHRHQAGSEGSRCINCHMPAKTYMGVDQRRDHGFRRPDPVLTGTLGSPDACTQCHADRPAGWTAKALADWGVLRKVAQPHPARGFAALWRGEPSAARSLAQTASDPAQPSFFRASALALLPTAPTTKEAQQAILKAAGDPDGLVRLGAAKALAALPPEERIAMDALALLQDPLRAVRIEAARALADIPAAKFPGNHRPAFQNALKELLEALKANAERPESHVELAVIHARRGDFPAAEKALGTALRLDRRFIPAYINLADLYRAQGRDAQGEAVLEKARRLAPGDASTWHALGLLRIRQGDKSAALPLLRRAVALDPDTPRYAYLLALALADSGAGEAALGELESARRRQPGDASLRQLQAILERRSRAGEQADRVP